MVQCHNNFINSNNVRILIFFHVLELGSYLATKKIRVVYGGSGFGLLGTLASSVLDNGGQLTGIIPEFFRSEYITKNQLTGAMCIRKYVLK